MKDESKEQLKREFDRQVENLLQKGYPEAAGLSVAGLLKNLKPLKDKIERLTVPETDFEKGRLPFIIVIKSDLVPTERAMLRLKIVA